MLLENTVAVIYGAGGPIGGAVARAFAREGARVFLAGRTKAKLDKVADEIRSNGGVADTAVVDALDERTVDEYAVVLVEPFWLFRRFMSYNALAGVRMFGIQKASIHDDTRYPARAAGALRWS
jgi:NAD(P)-dependent dehydrogenase (short-subunit alcohol dehydrogenase family)